MIAPLVPQLTEKSYDLAKNRNIYVFKVATRLNKAQIKEHIQSEYKVEVIGLKTLIVKGKRARSIRLKSTRAARVIGRRQTLKKAFISLKEGDVIPIFTNFVDETDKQPQQKGSK